MPPILQQARMGRHAPRAEGGSAVPASGTGAANMLKERVVDLDVECGDLLSHQGHSSFPLPCTLQVRTSASRRHLCVSFCRMLDL